MDGIDRYALAGVENADDALAGNRAALSEMNDGRAIHASDRNALPLLLVLGAGQKARPPEFEACHAAQIEPAFVVAGDGAALWRRLLDGSGIDGFQITSSAVISPRPTAVSRSSTLFWPSREGLAARSVSA